MHPKKEYVGEIVCRFPWAPANATHPAVLDAGKIGKRAALKMSQFAPIGQNRLLASLKPTDLALLSPHLTTRHFQQGTMLQEAGDPIDHVYFPCNGMISLLAVMPDGRAIETATIGREGAVGIMVALGARYASARAVVQVEGSSSRIASAKFKEAFAESESLRDLVLRYNDVQMTLIQGTAGCNALHHVEERLCRWLLQTRDRCDSDMLPLTHEFLSEMLGVQRSTVTMIARVLQSEGLIRYRRGQIEIISRAGLERRTCHCYVTTRRRNEQVFET